MTNVGVPSRGRTMVTLASVCNINGAHSGTVLTTTNVTRSIGVDRLSRKRVSALHSRITGFIIRNSLHHRVDVDVGHLVSLNYCHNLHRHHNLPIHNRHAGAGTHAHGNPHGPVGGWSK